MTRMKPEEVERSKSFIVVEIIEYHPNSVVTKTIIKKSTGTVSVISVDTGEEMADRISPFDTFVQVIDGASEIVIDGNSTTLHVGQGMVIPAHARSSIIAKERFKMMSTVIKSGYESVEVA